MAARGFQLLNVVGERLRPQPLDQEQALDAAVAEKKIELGSLGPRAQGNNGRPESRCSEEDLEPFRAIVDQNTDCIPPPDALLPQPTGHLLCCG